FFLNQRRVKVSRVECYQPDLSRRAAGLRSGPAREFRMRYHESHEQRDKAQQQKRDVMTHSSHNLLCVVSASSASHLSKSSLRYLSVLCVSAVGSSSRGSAARSAVSL